MLEHIVLPAALERAAATMRRRLTLGGVRSCPMPSFLRNARHGIQRMGAAEFPRVWRPAHDAEQKEEASVHPCEGVQKEDAGGGGE